jgi:hypothetical protein
MELGEIIQQRWDVRGQLTLKRLLDFFEHPSFNIDASPFLEEVDLDHEPKLFPFPDHFPLKPRERSRDDLHRASRSETFLGGDRDSGFHEAENISEIAVQFGLIFNP